LADADSRPRSHDHGHDDGRELHFVPYALYARYSASWWYRHDGLLLRLPEVDGSMCRWRRRHLRVSLQRGRSAMAMPVDDGPAKHSDEVHSLPVSESSEVSAKLVALCIVGVACIIAVMWWGR